MEAHYDQLRLESRRRIAAAHGRAVRNVHTAALAAVRAKANRFKDAYRRLIAVGKTPKLAIVAVMRKLIVALNAMVKNQTRWAGSQLLCRA